MDSTTSYPAMYFDNQFVLRFILLRFLIIMLTINTDIMILAKTSVEN